MAVAMEEIQQLFDLSCKLMDEAHVLERLFLHLREEGLEVMEEYHDKYHKAYPALGNYQGSAALGFYIRDSVEKHGKHCEALIWYGLNVQQDVEVRQVVSRSLDFAKGLYKATLHMSNGREVLAVCKNVQAFDDFLRQRAVAWHVFGEFWLSDNL